MIDVDGDRHMAVAESASLSTARTKVDDGGCEADRGCASTFFWATIASYLRFSNSVKSFLSDAVCVYLSFGLSNFFPDTVRQVFALSVCTSSTWSHDEVRRIFVQTSGGSTQRQNRNSRGDCRRCVVAHLHAPRSPRASAASSASISQLSGLFTSSHCNILSMVLPPFSYPGICFVC